MAKKILTYKGKPLYRKGARLFYGNLEDKYILVLDIIETKKVKKLNVGTKVTLQVQDNRGCELGEGQTFRKAERDDLFQALDIGEWWLTEALTA
jgi:hypothetical protein